MSLIRSGLDKEDSCLSVEKRDKKRNSFISVFCFIQLVFQVDWMYTHFILMRILRLMLGKCSKKSEVTLRTLSNASFVMHGCIRLVARATRSSAIVDSCERAALSVSIPLSSLKTFPAKLFENKKFCIKCL